MTAGAQEALLLLMIKILHYLKDPKLWELRCIPYYVLMQDLCHQPYQMSFIRGLHLGCKGCCSLRFGAKGLGLRVSAGSQLKR